MLVPARGFPPLRGCLRKGLTASSLRACSGYARKGKSGSFRPSPRETEVLMALPAALWRQRSTWRSRLCSQPATARSERSGTHSSFVQSPFEIEICMSVRKVPRCSVLSKDRSGNIQLFQAARLVHIGPAGGARHWILNVE